MVDFKVIFYKIQTYQMSKSDFNRLEKKVKEAIALCLIHAYSRDEAKISVLMRYYFVGKENKHILEEMKEKYG